MGLICLIFVRVYYICVKLRKITSKIHYAQVKIVKIFRMHVKNDAQMAKY